MYDVDKSYQIISTMYTVGVTKTKGHSLCKHCLHDLQFMKKGSSSTNLSNLAKADIICQFMKTRSLCRTFYKMNGLLGFSVQILLKYFYYCIVGFTDEIDIYSYMYFLPSGMLFNNQIQNKKKFASTLTTTSALNHPYCHLF